MKVLVINAGSSSLKYQLIDMATEKAVAKGGCERIGIEGSFCKHKANGDRGGDAHSQGGHSGCTRRACR